MDKAKFIMVATAVLALLGQVLNLYTQGQLDFQHVMQLIWTGLPALTVGGAAIPSTGMGKKA